MADPLNNRDRLYIKLAREATGSEESPHITDAEAVQELAELSDTFADGEEWLDYNVPALWAKLGLVSRQNTTRVAAFHPMRLDTLRPEFLPLVGEVATWRYAGVGGAHDDYPGQYRWDTDDPRWLGYWVPDEDLKDIEP